MNEVPVAALAPAIHKARLLKLCDQLSDFGRHRGCPSQHNVIPPQLRYTVGAAGYKPRRLRDAMQSW